MANDSADLRQMWWLMAEVYSVNDKERNETVT